MHDNFHHCPCQGSQMPTQTQQQNIPLIGDAAPQFVAQSTNGTLKFPDDYAGKWVILFSHPADFTPVCTTEFMAFQELVPQLNELNTELVGLSVGTLTGHLAWIDAIREITLGDMHDVQITFPIIDDMEMHVAKMYGMIHPHATSTHTVRAVFFIDPHGIIRTILYYPPSVGRNMYEIMRTLVALQTTDAFGVATPADWTPGEDVVAPAPATTAGLRGRIQNSDKSLDIRAWFLALKHLPEERIFQKLTQKNTKKTRK